jgi:hypothetical protein
MSRFPVIDKSELEAWSKAQVALNNEKANKKNKKETAL